MRRCRNFVFGMSLVVVASSFRRVVATNDAVFNSIQQDFFQVNCCSGYDNNSVSGSLSVVKMR